MIHTKHKTFVLATLKPWNIKTFNEVIKHYPGNWHLITDPDDLTIEKIKLLNPEYIFFPHWSNIVPNEIINFTDCICFHESDLPFGRGGSPIQNLIALGYKETSLSALKMTKEIDSGPIYLKKKLSLEGLGEEIYIRSSRLIAEMIKKIISENLKPEKQYGKPTFFYRRKPGESMINKEVDNLENLFNFIRMLDAETYPKAFLIHGDFKYEISRPALKTKEIVADIKISKISSDSHD